MQVAIRNGGTWMWYFIGISLFLSLLVFVISRKIRWTYKILFIVVLCALAVAAILAFPASRHSYAIIALKSGPTSPQARVNWYENPYSKVSILALFMILGMVTNYTYDYLQARIRAKDAAAQGRGKAKLPPFIWEKFLSPIIVSGLVFAVIWKAVGAEKLALTTILVSYQNGFFWQTLLSEKADKSSQPDD